MTWGQQFSFSAAPLFSSSPAVQGRAINCIRNILSCHDSDDRYSRHPHLRARVATLYLPLLDIMLDALPQLYTFASASQGAVKSPMQPPMMWCYQIYTGISGQNIIDMEKASKYKLFNEVKNIKSFK